MLLSPDLLLKSSHRIRHYNKTFEIERPFDLKILNEFLLAFNNEDFKLRVKPVGKLRPDNVYLLINERKIKMKPTEEGTFTFLFPKVQENQTFNFEAAGFHQGPYTLSVKNRPSLSYFTLDLNYPTYIGKKNEHIANLGNLTIPEGTHVSWKFQTFNTDSARMKLGGSQQSGILEKPEDNYFVYSQRFRESTPYELRLHNVYSQNTDKILYQIEVIKDQYPKITFEQFKDTTLFSYLIFGGNISDDYGLTALHVLYKKNDEKKFRTIPIRVDRRQRNQGYYFQWMLDSLAMESGDKIEYFLQVTDNDGINGRKSSKTATYIFKVPSRKEIRESIAKSSKQTEQDIDQALKDAQRLKESLENTEKKLKGKKYLDWQDRQALQQIVNDKKKLEEEISELQKQFKDEMAKRKHFEEMEEHKEIADKAEKLQELMNELLDDETKKLYDELQKLLNEQMQNSESIQNKLDEISQKEGNLENELDRALELFKRMKFDMKLSELAKSMDELSKKEEQLSQKKSNKENSEEIAEKQQQIDEEFRQMQKEMQELNKLNENLKAPHSIPDTQQEQQRIGQEQKNFRDAWQNKQRKKGRKAQKQMSRDMKQMAQKMQDMQNSMQMQQLSENLDDLRDIQSNLIKLSFNQEDVLKNLREVNLSDPKFVQFSQQQLKLKDDSRIIYDSLTALSKRVFQISTFVTRELSEMDRQMEEALSHIKERKIARALNSQQLSMTSMNNLALLLDDIMDQMQNQMRQSMGQPSQGDKQGSMKLSELQKQLNKQIKDLKKSGKSGRKLSEEIAKLAAEQEKIRRSLEQNSKKSDNLKGREKEGKDGEKFGKKKGEGEGNPYKQLIKEMENTELDLVNKRLTQEMINRQEEILTRLLENENADRERDLDEKREAEQATDYEQAIPKAFEEYIKLKEKELEQLKTVPLRFNPYYKKEVDRYFQQKNKKQATN